jgi:outer membrane lipoprotein SlyB
MTSTKRIAALISAVAVALAGCATAPSGPSVLVLPGSSKSFQMFEADDLQCRSWAERQTGVPPEVAAGQDAAVGAVVGTAIGATAGTLIGAAAGNPGAGAAIGAGSGLLLGSGQGYSNGIAHGASLQQRYDFAYTQCMYANGNQVPVARDSVPPPPPYSASSGRRLPPPPPPGLPPPPPPGAG